MAVTLGFVTLLDVTIGVLKLLDVYSRESSTVWDYRIRWAEFGKAIFKGYPDIASVFASGTVSQARRALVALLRNVTSEDRLNEELAADTQHALDEFLALALLAESKLVSHLSVTIASEAFLHSLERLHLGNNVFVVGSGDIMFDGGITSDLPHLSLQYEGDRARVILKDRAVRRDGVSISRDHWPLRATPDGDLTYLDNWMNKDAGTISSRVVKSARIAGTHVELKLDLDQEPQWLVTRVVAATSQSPLLTVWAPVPNDSGGKA